MQGQVASGTGIKYLSRWETFLTPWLCTFCLCRGHVRKKHFLLLQNPHGTELPMKRSKQARKSSGAAPPNLRGYRSPGVTLTTDMNRCCFARSIITIAFSFPRASLKGSTCYALRFHRFCIGPSPGRRGTCFYRLPPTDLPIQYIQGILLDQEKYVGALSSALPEPATTLGMH